jgi:hypothetical protein
LKSRHGTRTNLRQLAAGLALAMAAWVPAADADPIPPGWSASNMSPVGYAGLEGHGSPFKLSIKKSGNRWYLYAAHIGGGGGLSVTDVTDATQPKLVKFLPGPAGTGSYQISLHDNLLVWGMSRPLTLEQTSGATARRRVFEPRAPENRSYQEGAQLWDISDPVNPKFLSRWEGGAIGTHRNGYPGGKYAFMTSTVPGFSGNILAIVDVSDPLHPKDVSKWWYPGQKEGEQPASSVVASFHGPANVSPDGKMISTGYTPSVINLDISDIEHPKLIGEAVMSPPFADVGTQSVHSVLPLWDRKLLFANSESLRVECKEGLQWGALFDNSNPARPMLISTLPIPVPPANAPFKDFCNKGGRFGPHNTNQEIHLPDVEKPGNLIYLTYFNAGLRVYDTELPRLPKEVGWFVPPNPAQPIPSQGGMLTVNQTQDVLVDTRGYIYITDSAWGIWVLRYTGKGQPAPTGR